MTTSPHRGEAAGRAASTPASTRHARMSVSNWFHLRVGSTRVPLRGLPSTRPLPCRRFTASRTVVRLTPSVAHSAASVGTGPDDEPVGFRRLYDDVGIVDLDTPTEVAAPALTQLRVFAGYAGWGDEQLRDEIRTGSWYVVPSTPADLFGADPLGLWMRVLRRQPGELAWVSTRPPDPSMN